MATGGVGHTHQFDPISGWCAWCNLRDDGRLISGGGHVWRPGTGSSSLAHDTTQGVHA